MSMSSDRLVDPARVQLFRFPTIEAQAPVEAKASKPDQSEKKDPHEIEREAFQKGYQAGERSGLAVAEKKADAILKRFAKSVEELARLRGQIVAHAEKDLVNLALEIARKLIHREIQIDEKIIVTLVRVALEKLTVRNKVTVYVNPVDCGILQQNLSELLQDQKDAEIVLKENPELNRGDCQIESEYGSVDARIAEQFREVEKGLLASF